MMTRLCFICVLCCSVFFTSAQTEKQSYSDFPLVITLQFHAFTLPFRDIKANFSNIGIGVGTELSLNGKSSWVQQFNLIWYHNKALGNGISFYTQNAWRPEFATNTYAEVKLGAGYLYSFRPVKSFHQVDGEWVSAGRKGKGMFTIPTGVSIGYDIRTSSTYFSNFATYQFFLVNGYSKSIPLVPETIIQAGTRIHF